MCVCVCVCARARARACMVRACVGRVRGHAWAGSGPKGGKFRRRRGVQQGRYRCALMTLMGKAGEQAGRWTRGRAGPTAQCGQCNTEHQEAGHKQSGHARSYSASARPPTWSRGQCGTAYFFTCLKLRVEGTKYTCTQRQAGESSTERAWACGCWLAGSRRERRGQHRERRV